jgi:hypothetical protein
MEKSQLFQQLQTLTNVQPNVLDGKALVRSSNAFVSLIACSIADAGMALSNALRTVPDSIVGSNKLNSLRFICHSYSRQHSVYLLLVINRTVLGVVGICFISWS